VCRIHILLFRSAVEVGLAAWTGAVSFGRFVRRGWCSVINRLSVHGGPGSSVGIATDYGLDGAGSNPGRDEIYRPSRPALGPTPASCKMGTGSFPGLKCGRGVLLTTHPLLVPRSGKSRAMPLTHPLGHAWPTTGSLYSFCARLLQILSTLL